MKADVKEKVSFAKYDPADYINTKDDVIAMLEVALEEDDPDLLLEIIGDIARSKGMTKIAKKLDIDRRGLYKSLSPDGNPSFKTVYKLFNILGMRVRLEPKVA